MNKYKAEYSTRFRRNRRLLIKRGYDMNKLEHTVDLLLSGEVMPQKFKDHPLKGNYRGYRECHVDGEGDWLLIYRKNNDKLILVLTATGTHSDLFDE